MAKLTGGIRRWTQRLRTRKNAQWQARLRRSIDRHTKELREIQKQILQSARELKSRIEEELRVSPDEVRAFEAQLRKEVEEARQARQRVEEARQALVQAESQGDALAKDPQEAAQILQDLHRARRRTETRARVEAADVKRVEKEIASEAADRPILERELRRSIHEIEVLTATSTR